MPPPPSKDKLRLFWCNIANAGDALNRPIAEFLSGRPVEHVKDVSTDFCIGIGSTLFFPAVFIRDRVGIAPNDATMHAWGTGMFQEFQGSFRTRVKCHALRGMRSRDVMQEKLGEDLSSVALGDPGLLAPLLLSKRPERQYRLGLVPHHKTTQDLSDYCEVEDAVVIDTELPAAKFVRELAKCDAVLCEAMHGLIIADSLGVPNARMMPLESRGALSDFKFDDYYSALGLQLPRAFDLRSGKFTQDDLARLVSDYAVTRDVVKRVREDLLDACPFATAERKAAAIKKFTELTY